jgi:hypothetical protein
MAELKAVKGNREYSITESDRKKFVADGYAIIEIGKDDKVKAAEKPKAEK